MFRDLIKSCREKTRKAKAQLELNLGTVVRDNKKSFTNTLTIEREPRRISILYCMRGGNIAMKDEEKAKVLVRV